MRVHGDSIPTTMLIEPYHPMSGYVELRLRENITERPIEGVLKYEYDEYTFLLKDREGLREEIEAHLNDWLTSGRIMEINENASVFRDMKKALEILGVNTNAE